MKITKEKAVDLFNSLNDVGSLQGVKFAYAIARNINILKPEVEAIQKAIEPNNDFKEYNEKRVELAEKYSVKVDGKAKVENGQYVLENEDDFKKEFKLLKDKYKSVIDARQRQQDEFEEMIKEEFEIELFTLPVEYIPENISTDQMEGILSIVVEVKE